MALGLAEDGGDVRLPLWLMLDKLAFWINSRIQRWETCRV